MTRDAPSPARKGREVWELSLAQLITTAPPEKTSSSAPSTARAKNGEKKEKFAARAGPATRSRKSRLAGIEV
jgi:hypothetical protein